MLFLSLATLWTGWAFLQYRRRVVSSGATLLAAAFLLWGLHHLDYPFLRARGAWKPWGYYLDILLTLAVGAGILLLVLDDLRRGLGALSDISGDLQRVGREQDVLDALLARPLTLPAVRGTALFLVEDGKARFARGAGVFGDGRDPAPGPSAAGLLDRAIAGGRPQVGREAPATRTPTPPRSRCSGTRRPSAPSSSSAKPATRSPRSTTASSSPSASRSAPRWRTPISTAGWRPAPSSWPGSPPG